MKVTRINEKLYTFSQSNNLIDELPLGNYKLNKSMFGYYLERIEDFKFPEVIYNVDQDFRNAILTSFRSRNKNLGVSLVGTKGQGKTLNAKLLCKDANLPVIIITEEIDQDAITFLTNIPNDFIIYIDEFEKIYPDRYNEDIGTRDNKQNFWLNVLDGGTNFAAKVLFIFTSNETLSEFFLNRPSRIRYNKLYKTMPIELFNLIVDDLLVNKEFKDSILNNISLSNLNVDTLISIIEDCNTFNKDYNHVKDFFNYSPSNKTFNVSIFSDSELKNHVSETEIKGHEEHDIYNVNLYGHIFTIKDTSMYIRSSRLIYSFQDKAVYQIECLKRNNKPSNPQSHKELVEILDEEETLKKTYYCSVSLKAHTSLVF